MTTLISTETDGPLQTLIERIPNIFVTQPEDIRQEEEEIGNAAFETGTSKNVQSEVITFKKRMVVRKKAELDEVDVELALKRHKFNNSLKVLAARRSDLETKQLQTQERVMKFEKFVGENEVKRRRAQKKCKATHEQNIIKQREIECLTKQLQQLMERKRFLKDKAEKHRIYEDYLTQTLNCLPKAYHDNGYESLVMPIIRRHEVLSITHQELQQRLSRIEMQVEQGKRKVQTMKEDNGVKKLMFTKELYELQSEFVTLDEQNKQAEVKLMTEQEVAKVKVREVARLLMVINNLAQQCYIPAYGQLEEMSILNKLDMIKEYILDKVDTEQRARKRMRSGSLVKSKQAVMDTRWRGSIKSIESQTQIKSSSKFTQKSGTISQS